MGVGLQQQFQTIFDSDGSGAVGHVVVGGTVVVFVVPGLLLDAKIGQPLPNHNSRG